MEYAQVGVTIWRVGHGHSKGLAQVGEEQERLDTNAPYTNGDTIRLIIESATTGYMYIVDQEEYSDGSYSPAMLVFPTLKTRKGNNLIEAWSQVEVPAYPAVWRFQPRELEEGEVRKVQVAEVLTIVVSPKALVDSARIGDKQLALNKGEFEGWRKEPQRPVQQFDVENLLGQITKSRILEQVGSEGATEDEFVTQTIYQVAKRVANPIIVTVPLRFKTSAASAGKN
ncbi:MAG TPA: hypothetical protein DC054_01640 [Blastocatellia bacterium]|nr:hypothetical protein [Blastocatellia bacterium]